ncbi:MAG TPA: sigma-70 family RNA polymerase sigma factor [Planctomycetota bacterium]|nr:sigma-70 family RNA polymerase sigma factor [Planctomycetota bacterium]
MSPHDSRELVGAASVGERPAIEELIRRFLPRLELFVRLQMGTALRTRETSADLVQSVCVDLLSHLEGFQYESEEKFVSWLFAAALNKVREKVRFHGRERRGGEREAAGMEVEQIDAAAGPGMVTPSRIAMAREELERLEQAFLQLPPDYREVVVLSRIVGLPHAAIAAQLGRTEAATRKLLGRAVARLGELTASGG